MRRTAACFTYNTIQHRHVDSLFLICSRRIRKKKKLREKNERRRENKSKNKSKSKSKNKSKNKSNQSSSDSDSNNSSNSSSSSDGNDSDEYHPGFLDDPNVVHGRHRHTLIGDKLVGPIVSSTIQFVRPAALKAELNKQVIHNKTIMHVRELCCCC